MKDNQFSEKKSTHFERNTIRRLVLQAQQDEDYPGLELVASARSKLAAHNLQNKKVNDPPNNDIYERTISYVTKKCDYDQTNTLWNTAI